jgi:predicted porin
MQKSLIALAVLSAIATTAQAQSSATIYGTVDTGAVFSNKVYDPPTDEEVGKISIIPGVTQGSYIGFKGVEDLGSGMRAFFELETGFSSNANQNQPQQKDHASGNLFRQKSVVGLDSSLGSVSLGLQSGVIDDLNQSVGSSVGQPADHTLDFSRSLQSKNSIRYNTPNISGFTGSLAYNFSEMSGLTSTGEAFGVAGKYEGGPLGLYAAYYQAGRAATPGPVPKDYEGVYRHPVYGTSGDIGLEALSIGAGYHSGPAYFYSSWLFLRQPYALGFSSNDDPNVFHSETSTPKAYHVGSDDNSKSTILKLGVDYSVNKLPLHLIADASYKRGTYLCEEAVNPAHLSQVTLGADYSLSQRTHLYTFVSDLYAHEEFNTSAVDNAHTRNPNQISIAVGIRHKF